MKAAGFEKAKGLITANYGKDAADPRWKDDAGFKAWREFAEKTSTAADLNDSNAIYGYDAAILMVHVLKQCGDDLSRENILKQATNLQGSRTADAAAGHQDQYLADQLQPDPADAIADLQRRELGAVRRTRQRLTPTNAKGSSTSRVRSHDRDAQK